MLRRIAAAKSVAETSVHDDVMDAVRRMQLAIRDGTSNQRSLFVMSARSVVEVGEVNKHYRRVWQRYFAVQERYEQPSLMCL